MRRLLCLLFGAAVQGKDKAALKVHAANIRYDVHILLISLHVRLCDLAKPIK